MTDSSASIPTTKREIDALIQAAQDSDPSALDALLEQLHQELKTHTRRCRGGVRGSFRTTEVFQETYLKVFGKQVPSIVDQDHLFALWGQATRWVVLSRWRATERRRQYADEIGRSAVVESFVAAFQCDEADHVADALAKLESIDEPMARAVDLYYFSGLSVADVAHALDCSKATAERLLRRARHWLFVQLNSDDTRQGGAG